MEAVFPQVAKNYQVLCQTVGGGFSAFLPKIKNANPIWQTIGRCSNMKGKTNEES
jgi:hypothetical protein